MTADSSSSLRPCYQNDWRMSRTISVRKKYDWQLWLMFEINWKLNDWVRARMAEAQFDSWWKISLFTLAKLQLCREEREKIIREEALNQPMSMSTRLSEPRKRSCQTSWIVSNTPTSRFQSHPSSMIVLNHDGTRSRISIGRAWTSLFLTRIFMSTKFNPSDSLLDGLNQPTTISSVAARSHSASAVKFSDYESNAHLPPRSTGASSILKSTGNRWAPPTSSTSYYHDDEPNNQYDLRASSSMSFGDDVRRMVNSSRSTLIWANCMPLNRIRAFNVSVRPIVDRRDTKIHDTCKASISRSFSTVFHYFRNGLENVKEMIERRAPQSAAAIDPESATFEKKQYEILLGQSVNGVEGLNNSQLLLSSFDHELKIQKAQKNARQTEKEKEVERYESLLHDFEVNSSDLTYHRATLLSPPIRTSRVYCYLKNFPLFFSVFIVLEWMCCLSI